MGLVLRQQLLLNMHLLAATALRNLALSATWCADVHDTRDVIRATAHACMGAMNGRMLGGAVPDAKLVAGEVRCVSTRTC
jgi:hypothetical protein